MRRLADERGFSLVELLVVMTLSTGLLGATLMTVDNMLRSEHANDARMDTVEQARNALDVQARQLRNLAKRVSSPVIDTVSSYDLIFQTSDPSRTWVRYCLDTSTAPASTSRGRLWTAELSVPSAATATPVTAGMRGGCPGTGWTTTRIVADYVTNRRGGQDRPLFEYGCSTGTTCTSTATTYDRVVDITAQTIVDTTPGKLPSEISVASGVYLRNQNQAPVAVWSNPAATGPRTIVLNGSGSSDFEGRTLNYYWFKTNLPAAADINCAQPIVTGTGALRTLWGAAGFLGEGITLSHTFPLSDGPAGAPVPFALVVCDPGDRYGSVGISPQPAQTVNIPT
jgi:prepilin-type N-terminal cleavage/methylation domain-containing protein